MRFSTLIMVLAMMLCTASLALADNPPSWRGSAGTTFQQWTFSTSATSPSPESATNAYGSAAATVSVDSLLATGYWDSFPEVYGSAQGLWDIGTGSITLSIPNTPNMAPDTFKDIQVWMKYWVAPSAAPGILVSPTASLVSTDSAEVESVGPMGSWWAGTWLFRVTPNPDHETITILGDQFWGSQIDEIVVDTRCGTIPEPSSLAALFTAMVGLAGLRRLRRRA